MVFGILAALLVASSSFIPVSVLPGWLQPFTTDQPLTQIVDAARSLVTGGGAPASSALWVSLAWCVGLPLVLAILTLRKSRRITGAHRRPSTQQDSPFVRQPGAVSIGA
jgi:ABC-2 type transport system permease protein/oleandomycin transport system permease protein